MSLPSRNQLTAAGWDLDGIRHIELADWDPEWTRESVAERRAKELIRVSYGSRKRRYNALRAIETWSKFLRREVEIDWSSDAESAEIVDETSAAVAYIDGIRMHIVSDIRNSLRVSGRNSTARLVETMWNEGATFGRCIGFSPHRIALACPIKVVKTNVNSGFTG